MKNLLKLLLVVIFLSSAMIHAATAVKEQSLTQKMLKPLIEQQCASELKASKVWQASALFLSVAQQSRTQSKVCGCVSENAMHDISTKDILVATVNESVKNELMTRVVMNSLKGCAQDAFK
ncbi:hypothetical protein [Acinetobacter sp. ANC 4648]|uniref:hypothetical protein n=1 Tax=Acinetobacter sp. ANC 4648 TaxID=1977875 RepID=UPI000A34945F|nr:hypothetical protein [Acinetobacter sp. ANC 4648]OTG83135.1 hypothetical protein B9T27_07680 [Acinetobacter sp. ANC 4648]